MFRLVLLLVVFSTSVHAQSYLGFNAEGKLVPLQKGNAPSAYGSPTNPSAVPTSPTSDQSTATVTTPKPPKPTGPPPRPDPDSSTCMSSGCTGSHSSSSIRR